MTTSTDTRLRLVRQWRTRDGQLYRGPVIPETCRNAGHPLTEDTVLIWHPEHWRCRACIQRHRRKYRQRLREQRHPGHTIVVSRTGRHICHTCWMPRVRIDDPDIDDIAVERAVAGNPPARLRPAERAAAIVQLREQGLTHVTIAARVGCSDRTVLRALSRARRQAEREGEDGERDVA